MAKDKEEALVEATEVTVQTTKAFKLPNGEVVDINDFFIWMANEIIAIRKAVG